MGITAELWKDLLAYEGHYQISSRGRIKSIKYGKSVILKLKINKDGHYIIGLRKGGKRKWFFVHRLVYHNFVNVLNLEQQIHHKDENRANNIVTNLEVISPYNHNSLHHRGVKNSNTKLTIKDVIQIKMLLKLKVLNQPGIARHYGVSHTTISCIKHGKQWGYIIV